MAAIIGNRNITLGVLGGTLITACAGFGGDVFGCSPYDAATTRYLKATYPQYWQAIRNFGLDNPQLVEWINEDNDLIVSLVEVGKERWQHATTVGSYYQLGVPLYGQSTGVRIGYKFTNLSLGSSVSLFGARDGYGNNDFSINFGAWNFGTYYIGYKSQHSETMSKDYVKHIVSLNKGVFKHDNTTKNYSLQTFNQTRGAWLFGNNNEDGHPLSPYCLVDKCEMFENDEPSHIFVPFKRNGQMELLDIVTGTLATRVGTFTELIE